MPKVKRKIDYLFKRPGSANWYVKLQGPGGLRIEKSLGTSDRRQAEILALHMVAEHKARLLAARPRLEASWWHVLPPGRKYVIDNLPATIDSWGDSDDYSRMTRLTMCEYGSIDAREIVATERELLYYNDENALVKRKPNGGPAQQLVNLPMGALIHGDKAPLAELRRKYKGAPFLNLDRLDRLQRGAVPTKNGDDTILEIYLKHAGVTGHFEREARNVWALFKTLTNSKPLKECTREDGRKLVRHFENEGLKTATIHKKIAWLNAACNFAIKENTLRFNPFASIVPRVDDAERRLPLDEADMKVCRRKLGTLSETDQLLFRLLAATGMRLGEAFQINGEATERGVRYVVVGTKTEASKRRVPLPTVVLLYLPKAIKGPLFAGGPPAASKRLNRFLRDSGVAAAGKVVHSLRHRAADRLRAAGAPVDIRYALLGHETRTVADSYGAGHPVPLLRKWIDKIGF
jgi:integrase